MSEKEINNNVSPGGPEGNPEEAKTTAQCSRRRHIIRPKWLRIVVRTLMWIVIVVLLIPVLLYIPTVQTFVKNIACREVYKSTGMKVDIERFRLSFPVDVNLDGVTVLYAGGDTMVRARQVVADVKLLPLLRLDVKVKRLQLIEGYYKMVSPDSSMIMKIAAGYLDVDDKSSANIALSEINLNKALIKDGSLSLYMDVWKQKPTPQDSTSTPFLIKGNDITLENFDFAMSMLPTIDTLQMHTDRLRLLSGIVDLRTNNITARSLKVSEGNFRYIAPTAEYVRNHPAPAADPSAKESAPICIKGDTVSLDGFKVLYATKGVSPAPGFDPGYIELSDVGIGLQGFYNEASTVTLPITRLSAKERSGLQITRGSGTVGIDSIGLNLSQLDVQTLYSRLYATADIPFALMEMQPTAPLSVEADGSFGMPDIEAFMPAVKEYTSKIGKRNPLNFNLAADGTLGRVNVKSLKAAIPGAVKIDAQGYAENVLAIENLKAALKFNGQLDRPSLVESILGKQDFNIPTLTIDGRATVDRQNYTAVFDLLTSAGDVAADAEVGLNSERYYADLNIHHFDICKIMPSLGIGAVTAKINAEGDGFNPEKSGAATDVNIDLASIVVNHQNLRDIHAQLGLHDGLIDLTAYSSNPDLDLLVEGTGTVAPDNYTFDVTARLNHVDLMALGFSETVCDGHGDISVRGSASPDRWLYDVDLTTRNIVWSIGETFIDLPGGVDVNLLALADNTKVKVNSGVTSLDFEGEAGLKTLIDSFDKCMALATKQVDARSLQVEQLRTILPRFAMRMNARGSGLLDELLSPSGMSLDTVYAEVFNDTILHARAAADGLSTGGMKIDSLRLNISQRGEMLDYLVHMGNRPGTLDEFANVDVRGYLGDNRLSAYAVQKNISGVTGYRVGLTAAMMDSLVSLHFTPLKATIAYMPWTMNSDNYIDYHLNNGRIEADVTAKSKESSLMIRTEPLLAGGDELHVALDNIKIEDFLQMSLMAPPLAGAVNADIRVRYDGHDLSGNGSLGVRNLVYDGHTVGDLNFGLYAAMQSDKSSHAEITMDVNGSPALAAYARLVAGDDGMKPEQLGLRLTEFPLSIANAFMAPETLSLAGALNGDMEMTGTLKAPMLNGSISFDKVAMTVPMIGTTFRFADNTVPVADNLITFNNFDIYGVNENPLVINGVVDAHQISKIAVDMNLSANNIQLVGTGKNAKSAVQGKLFMNLTGSAKGRLSMLNVNATAGILGQTDLLYNMESVGSDLSTGSDTDVVKFVNFNDTTQTATEDSIVSPLNMRVLASVGISQGAKVAVNLNGPNSTNRVELHPFGTLTYFQNYMGDMKLNGQLNTGEGFVRYSQPPILSEKLFVLDPSSYVVWNGDVMNPVLHVKATDDVKVNVTSSNGSSLVNFLVTVAASNSLSSPNITFDLSTNDDMTVQNELESMTADQRATQAMNILLYGHYSGPNVKTAGSNVAENMLYGLIEGQLNNLAARYVKGVDLSFGIDQYDNTVNGTTSSTTTYSYQVSKNLFSNRFKILVGGNYNTDSDADENLSQNLISDISFEYMIKQTNSTSLSAKIFRHTGYESILEGEVTEMGVGLVMKRKLGNLSRLFRFGRRRRNTTMKDTIAGDTVTVVGTTSSGNKAINKAINNADTLPAAIKIKSE